MTALPDEPGERQVAELGLRLGEIHGLGDLLAAGAGGRHSKQGRRNIVGGAVLAAVGAGLTIAMLFPLLDEIGQGNGFGIALMSGFTLLGLLMLVGGAIGLLPNVTGARRWWLGLYEGGVVVARDRGRSAAVPWTAIDSCSYLTTEIYYNGAHTRDTHVMKIRASDGQRWSFDAALPGVERLGPLAVFLHAATVTESLAQELAATGRVAVPHLDGAALTTDGVTVRGQVWPWTRIGSITGHTPETWDKGRARLLDEDGGAMLAIPMGKGLHSRKVAFFNLAEQLVERAGVRRSDPGD